MGSSTLEYRIPISVACPALLNPRLVVRIFRMSVRLGGFPVSRRGRCWRRLPLGVLKFSGRPSFQTSKFVFGGFPASGESIDSPLNAYGYVSIAPISQDLRRAWLVRFRTVGRVGDCPGWTSSTTSPPSKACASSSAVSVVEVSVISGSVAFICSHLRFRPRAVLRHDLPALIRLKTERRFVELAGRFVEFTEARLELGKLCA